jgi:hypothetical protein
VNKENSQEPAGKNSLGVALKSRYRDLAAVLTLLLLPFIVYSSLVTGTATFAGYDHSGINQPLKQQVFDGIRGGRLPFWEPRLDRGLPLFAEGEAGIYYPVNWLFLIPVDFLALYNIVLLLLLGFAGVFFFWWVRRLGAGPLAACLGAVAHQWGATVTFNKANMNITEGYILAPLLLMLLEPSTGSFSGAGKNRDLLLRTAGIGVVFACMIFAGQAQYVAYSGLFALIYMVLRILFSEKQNRINTSIQTGIPFIGGIILGLGLAAIQLLPQLELIPLSERSTDSLDTRFSTFGLWLNPSRLFAAYIFPVYHYSVDQFLPSLSTTVWVGPVAILLAGYAIRTKRLLIKPIIPLLIIGLIFLYLAMGANAPLAGWITSLGPLGHFRGHGRLAGYFALAILALMSLGLDALLKQSGSPSQNTGTKKYIPLFSIEIAMMLLLTIPFLSHYRDYLETKFALGVFAGFLLIFLFGLNLSRIVKSKIPLIIAIMIVLVAQIFGCWATSSESMLLRSSWDANRADLLYIRDNSSPDEATFIAIRALASNKLHERFIQNGIRELIPGPRDHVDYVGSADAGLMENLTVMNTDLPLELSRWERLVHRELWPTLETTKGALSPSDTNLLWILGVNWIVTENADLEIDGFEKQSDPSWKNRDIPFYIYHRLAPIRPYEIFSNWISSPAGDDATIHKAFQDYLQNGAPDQTAFLEGATQPVPTRDNPGSESLRSKISTSPSKNPATYAATVTVSDQALFMIRSAWYPGWTVTVNGQPADLVRADSVFKAVVLKPGRNEVVFTYKSTYFRLGLLVSVITVLILLVMILPNIWKRAVG